MSQQPPYPQQGPPPGWQGPPPGYQGGPPQGYQGPGPMGPPPGPRPKPSWYRRPWGIGLLVVVGLALIGGLLGDDPDTSSAVASEDTASDAPVAVETTAAEPTAEPTPSETPEPEPTATPPADTSLQGQIEDALSASNRDQQRVALSGGDGTNPNLEIIVTVAFNDNLTEGLVKDGARIDTRDVLETIASQPNLEYTAVRVIGTFPLADQLGNSEEAQVVNVVYDRALIEQINFDGFLIDNAWEVATSATIHPAFQP